MAEVVNAAVDGTQALLIQKDLSIKVNLEPDLPRVWNNRDRLVQVVTNLLSNSIKFTPNGGMVWITAKKFDDGGPTALGGKLEVCVSDTGIGIEFVDHENIFHKFKQVGDTLSDKPKGTGLGLPICKGIVEYFGGEIWVESKIGKDSASYFTVPISSLEQARELDETANRSA